MLQHWGRAFYSDYWKLICQTGSDFYSLASGDRVFELLELQERPTLTPVQKHSSFSTSTSLCLSISASWLSLSFSSFHLFQLSLFKTTFSNSLPFHDTAPYLIRLSASLAQALSFSPLAQVALSLSFCENCWYFALVTNSSTRGSCDLGLSNPSLLSVYLLVYRYFSLTNIYLSLFISKPSFSLYLVNLSVYLVSIYSHRLVVDKNLQIACSCKICSI